MNTKRGRRRREALQYLWLLIYEINVELIILYKIHLMTNLTNLEVHTHGRPGVCNWLGEQGWVFKATHNRKQPTKVEFHVYRWQTLLLYFYRLSLNQTGTAIGWFLVTWPWLKSNVSRSWYIKQCTPIRIHYSTWSKHGGKWCDRRQEKHCQFSFSWMNTTTFTITQTWSLKLKSNDFQSYPRRETAASGGKRCR